MIKKIYTFLFIFFIYLLPLTVFASEIKFSENFDSYSNGSLNGQGGWTGSNDIVIQSTVYNSASKATNDTTTGDDLIEKTIETIEKDNEDNYQIISYVRCDEVGVGKTGEISAFRLGYNSTNYVNVNFSCSTAVIRILDNATWRTVASGLSADTWYKVTGEWNFSNDLHRAKVDEGSWSDWYSFESGGTAISFNKLGSYHSNAFAKYWDDITIIDNTEATSTSRDCQPIIIVGSVIPILLSCIFTILLILFILPYGITKQSFCFRRFNNYISLYRRYCNRNR